MQTLTEELDTYKDVLFPRTRAKRVLIHIAFWCLFIGFHLLFFIPAHPERLKNPDVVVAYILYYGRYIPIYYLMVLFFRFLRRHFKGVLRLICLTVFVIAAHHWVTTLLFHFYQARYGINNLPGGFQVLGRFYLDCLSTVSGQGWGVLIYDLSELQLFILPVCIKTLKHSLMLIMHEAQRQQQKLVAELKYLRFQLTPHFILNVLTAASTEIIRSPKKRAASYLLQVADMIRFSIYDIEQDFVALEKELRYVEQYLELESARTAHRSEIFYTKKGLINEKHQVPTLILVTLVENAFKHGVHSTHTPCEVTVKSEVTSDWLYFQVLNSKPADRLVTEKENENQSGIGLANIKKTLALKFGQNYRFEITENDLEYSVILGLPLLTKKQKKGDEFV